MSKKYYDCHGYCYGSYYEIIMVTVEKQQKRDRTCWETCVCRYEEVWNNIIMVHVNTYHKFNNIDGRKIGTKSRDAKIENTSKKLFSFFLTLKREIRVNTSTTMHSNCPTTHVSLSHKLSELYPYGVFVIDVWSLQQTMIPKRRFYRQIRTSNAYVLDLNLLFYFQVS